MGPFDVELDARVSDAPVGEAKSSIDAFVRSLKGLRGVSDRLRSDGVDLSFDARHAERVGPLLEARAAEHGTTLRLRALDADLPPAGLDDRPSGVWAAIGDGAEAMARAAERGHDGGELLLQFVRVVVGERRLAVDGRAPRVEPSDLSAINLGPTKYDDFDYHDGAAIDAGQPREHGFTHIGLFLAWLIRHDLVDPWFIPESRLDEVKSGARTGSDLIEDIDGKIVSDMLAPEGDRFAAARYEWYLEDYERLFADAPAYGVPDDAPTYAKVAPMIDARYAEWVAAGRPPPEAQGSSVPHEAPDLEALVPRDLTSPPMRMSSVRAPRWGSPGLVEMLRRLGVRPLDGRVATGIGGVGEHTLSVTVYFVLGIDRDTLCDEFTTLIDPGDGLEWLEDEVGDRSILRATGPGADGRPLSVLWASYELVVHVYGPEADALRAIERVGRG